MNTTTTALDCKYTNWLVRRSRRELDRDASRLRGCSVNAHPAAFLYLRRSSPCQKHVFDGLWAVGCSSCQSWWIWICLACSRWVSALAFVMRLGVSPNLHILLNIYILKLCNCFVYINSARCSIHLSFTMPVIDNVAAPCVVITSSHYCFEADRLDISTVHDYCTALPGK